MKKLLALILVSVTLLTMAPAALAATDTAFVFPFTDVAANNPHREAISYCAEHGFIKGITETSFDSDGTLRREQMATIWARTFHVRMHSFTDVQKVTNEMDNAIIVMHALGFFNGADNTVFSRWANISREDVAAVAARTYLPGVDGQDKYKDYTDSASIADYAKDGVSACLLKGIFDDVFTGAEFKPKQHITRGEMCHIIYNVMNEKYTITMASMTGGAVTSSRAAAREGQTVTLTVTPETGKQLKAGTLMLDGAALTVTGTTATFTMPKKDVVISAEFEDAPVTLTSIKLTDNPTKTTYAVGDALDLTGLTVSAVYTDAHETVLTASEYTASPADGATLTANDKTVTISYTEGGVTKTATAAITVNP